MLGEWEERRMEIKKKRKEAKNDVHKESRHANERERERQREARPDRTANRMRVEGTGNSCPCRGLQPPDAFSREQFGSIAPRCPRDQKRAGGDDSRSNSRNPFAGGGSALHPWLHTHFSRSTFSRLDTSLKTSFGVLSRIVPFCLFHRVVVSFLVFFFFLFFEGETRERGKGSSSSSIAPIFHKFPRRSWELYP